MWQLVAAQAERDRDAPAILALGRAPLSYAGLAALLQRTARTLAGAGVDRNDHVALVCSNGPEAATAFLGIASCCACAPLNPTYRAAEFEFFFADLQPRAVVIEAGIDSAAASVARSRGLPVFPLIPDVSAPAGTFALNSDAAPAPPAWPQSGDVALLLHTSGTTSRPKLVPLTHANLDASARNIAAALELTQRDRCLNVMPLFHIHGLGASILATFAAGGSVVCAPGFLAPDFFDWVEEFRPTWYTAAPAIHQSVLARAGANPAAAARHPFRFIRSCSSALPPSLMEEMERVFQVPVIEAYGMTEAAHQMASNLLPPGRRKPGSVGVAAGVEIAVMDEDGNLLQAGTAGEFVIRGDSVTSGYLNNPEANRRAFTGEWFRTGDQGFIDEEGFLFLTGRLKEIINRGGEKIAPREIDEVLLRHPAVSQAAAFAAPHPSLGESVAAAVVVRSSAETSTMELREFAALHLADFKVPERIVFVDELPKGPTGKVQRIGLAERLGVAERLGLADTPKANGGSRTAATPAEEEMCARFAAILGIASVCVEDNFFTAGGDSILAARLLVAIRERTGKDLPFVRFLDDPTAAGVVRNLERAPSAWLASTDLRVVIQTGGSEPPLVCLPGSYGNLAGFCNLARHIGPDRPVVGFRLPPSSAEQTYCGVEELATRCLSEVVATQPAGPYALVGVCTGGLVAYEMARQIQARGESVSLLALMDCYNQAWARDLPALERLNYRFRHVRRRLAYHRRNLREGGASGALRYLRPRFAALALTARERTEELAFRSYLKAGLRPPAWLRDPRIEIRHAAQRYNPSPWPGRLLLFRVAEPRDEAYDYPEMGWRGLAGGLEIHDLPGSHLTMLMEPDVRTVAKVIREAGTV